MFLWYNHPSSCTEVNCLMLLASYFSQPSWLCLIDPLKRGHGPFLSLDVLFCFSSWHFLSLLSSGMDSTAWTQNALPWNTHKCTCGRLVMPGLQMLNHRETLELHLKGRLTLALWVFWGNSALISSTHVSGVRIQSSLPAARLPTGQKISWQRLFPFSNDYDFVLFGTSVGFMLLSRDPLIAEKKAKLDRPNQSSIWRIWWCCNCTSCRAKMSLPLNKHTSSWLPVCSCKHARKSFLSTQKKNNRGKKTVCSFKKRSVSTEKKEVGGFFFFHELFLKDWTARCKQWSSS